MTFIALLLGSLSTAQAVPTQLVQQGRLLDSNGVAISGAQGLTFRIYDVETGGAALWEDVVFAQFEGGYYTAVLGANTNLNPLDDSLLDNPALYLEVQVNADPPLSPRQQVLSTAYSRLAAKSESLEGGTVNATEISVNGTLVIDSNGSWVGPVMAVNWADLQGVPADIADGDDDTLAGISCNTGHILGWNGSQWACAADNGLTEAEVELYVTNDAIDLHANTTVGGLPILTQGDGDTLSGLSCQNGEVAKYDLALGQWACDIDLDTDTQLSESQVEAYVTNGSLDFGAGSMVGGDLIVTQSTDATLSESAVEGYVTNGALDLAGGTTLNGRDIVSNAGGCLHGEVLTWDANLNEWICNAMATNFDNDGDGIMAWDDCDDSDPQILGKANDADCDGIATADDCNDSDPNSTAVVDDADCDGTETADDCDDTDPNSTILATDADCDGAITALDCNDNEPMEAPGLSEICEDGYDNDCNGGDESCTCDPNTSGTLNNINSGFCDSSPPSGWTQCAGWTNTSGDDVADNVLDGCLNNNGRLRIRVWYNGNLEEDVYSENASMSSWNNWNYHGGSMTKDTSTYWTGNTEYFSTLDGRDACGQQSAPNGLVLGTGNASSIVLAPGNTNGYEYRVSCGGQSLTGRDIAVYY